MMKQEEYVKELGLVCPNCGSEKINGSDYEYFNGSLHCDCFCYKCMCSWTDTFTLTGYTDLIDCESNPIED